jgi:hypothetical protein
MPFPKTEEELEAQGYKFKSASQCRSCHAPIEFWETPNGKMIPLNDDCTAHFATCPEADKFRRTKR